MLEFFIIFLDIANGLGLMDLGMARRLARGALSSGAVFRGEPGEGGHRHDYVKGCAPGQASMGPRQLTEVSAS